MIDLNRQFQLRESIELFYFGYRAFTAHADRLLARRGLGRVHHRILYFVGRNPDVAINSLLRILGVTKQALNAPLRQLIEKGLVAVCPATHDRRVRQLCLTRDGQKLEGQLTGIQMKQLVRVFQAAGPKAERGWRVIMQSMSDGGRDE